MRERHVGPSLLDGAILGGAYQIVGRIGQGAMGGIYEARQLRLDKRVAVKVMARELSASAEALERFRREAEITSQLGHPHIITVFDFGTSPFGEPYLVMEYLEGEDLSRRIERWKRVPLQIAVRVVKQVSSALAETHAKGIVHRDLKPANIFLVRVQGEDFAKVLDFGISKIRAASTALTGVSVLVGTPMYMAPEQAEGRLDELDQWTDQWALACIAYEMLAGRPPFQGDDVGALLYQVVHHEPPVLCELVEGLPPSVERVIRRALSKHQSDRYESVTAFAEAFEAAARGAALSEPGFRATAIAALRPTRRKRRWALGGAAVAAGILAAFALWGPAARSRGGGPAVPASATAPQPQEPAAAPAAAPPPAAPAAADPGAAAPAEAPPAAAEEDASSKIRASAHRRAIKRPSARKSPTPPAATSPAEPVGPPIKQQLIKEL
jgi:serine/threonine-protein kinase